MLINAILDVGTRMIANMYKNKMEALKIVGYKKEAMRGETLQIAIIKKGVRQ